MNAHAVSSARAVPQRVWSRRKQLFVATTLLIVCGAIVRSALATRLDSFTLDEAYHITAGVSYVRYADFRINPEHPPLVKLWVGSFMSATGFYLSSLRPFADKSDERAFAEQDVYLHNDFNSVQRRARIAMASVLLEVPSAIVPQTSNYVFNPLHPDASHFTIVQTYTYPFDVRIKQ